MARYYFAQNREDLIIKGFFWDIAAGTYIDVGANDPVIDSVTKLLYDSGWSGINIEPQPRLFSALKAHRPRDINLNIGIASDSGTLLFTEFPDASGLSSFDRSVVDRIINTDRHPATRTAIERAVPVETLSTIIRETGVQHIHVMKIDVEGYEYEALSGMDWSGVRPELICIEANKINPARDWRPILKRARYSKVFHDGLNDYWLAEESSHRKHLFDYPTAVFPESPIYYPAAVALEMEIRNSLAGQLVSAPTPCTTGLQLIIDAQLLQSTDRHRGMGRYALSLIRSIDTSSIPCTFITNSNLPPLDAQAVDLLSQQGRIIDLALLHGGTGISFSEAMERNRSAITQLVSDLARTQPARKTVFVMPALFSAGIHPVFPAAGTSNLLIFYDLIPYLFPHLYLQGDRGRDYSERFSEFYRADHYACDSQSAADDLTVHLGVDPSRITTILGASSISPDVAPVKPESAHDLDRFILVASGNDPRKNNEAATAALCQLGPDITPVFTSRYPHDVQQRLRSICSHARFTGDVTDAELLWLIDHADFVFFPSLYEGLGLPVLEAVERGTPVVCSHIPSILEMSETAFHYFDPYSIDSMTLALRDAVTSGHSDAAHRSAEYAKITARFNWHSCGQRFMRAAEEALPAERTGRLAVLAPSPAGFSAVGTFALQSYAELSRYFAIDYFGECGLPPHPAVRFNVLEHTGHYFPAAAFGERATDYDHVVYHIGNSDFHATTAINAFLHPGTTVIHDTELDGLISHTVSGGIAPDELRAQVIAVDAALGLTRSKCLAWLAARQRIVAVFSRFAEDAVTQIPLEGASILRVCQPVGVPSRSGHGTAGCTVAFAGIVAASKGLSLAGTLASMPGVAVKIFGFDPWGISDTIPRHPNIRFVGNVTDLQFREELYSSDIVVNYRPSYHGETSRSTLEAMAAGAVVVVRRIGWFDELPDDVVMKVDSEEEVGPTVLTLAGDPIRRVQIGRAARTFLARRHGYGAHATSISSSIRVALARDAETLGATGVIDDRAVPIGA